MKEVNRLEENINRQEQIHAKGFDMYRSDPEHLYDQYGRIKVGPKDLEDAVVTFGQLTKTCGRLISKGEVLKALHEKNLPKLREISNHFYHLSGVYQRTCDYYANLYRYDWYVVPEIYDDEKLNEEKIISDFINRLGYLDNSHIKKLCGEIALKVILNGCYYGYIVDESKSLQIQELPPNYCRSRYSVQGVPSVEFNMRFFDDKFPDTQYRIKILKMFPKEFQKGYVLYKEGKLIDDSGLLGEKNFYSSVSGWYLLDPKKTIKFNLNNTDMPIFISAIPAILDLDAAQDLDRRKQMQQLLKILIQKLPLDKNNELVFDVEEAKDIHNNAVNMLQRAIGVDVVTTFADVEAIDLADKHTTTTQDDLSKVERTVYNALGVAKNLFNADGNLALNNSILEDEATMRNLLLQFEIFFDRIIASKVGSQKKIKTRFYMLETTQFNYKEMSKIYKEQVQIGYSKMLPQIALGHSQSSIINTAYFENNVLHLTEVMIPPLMSSTMSSADVLGKTGQTNQTNSQNSTEGNKNQTQVIKTEEKNSGRPEKPDDQKSEKTIKNKESMS